MKRIIVLLLAILVAIALVVLAFPISTTTAKDTYLTYEELKAYHEQKIKEEAARGEQEWSAQLVAHSKTLVGKKTGQCVLALRNYFGISRDEVQGAAKYTKPNTQTPKVGAIIIFKHMSKVGHVGIVIKVDGAVVTYFDSNGDWRGRGAIRTIINNDRRISGYRITK